MKIIPSDVKRCLNTSSPIKFRIKSVCIKDQYFFLLPVQNQEWISFFTPSRQNYRVAEMLATNVGKNFANFDSVAQEMVKFWRHQTSNNNKTTLWLCRNGVKKEFHKWSCTGRRGYCFFNDPGISETNSIYPSAYRHFNSMQITLHPKQIICRGKTSIKGPIYICKILWRQQTALRVRGFLKTKKSSFSSVGG